MNECRVSVDTKKIGVYLSWQQVDLLELISCKSYDEVRDFMSDNDEAKTKAFSGQFPLVKRKQLTHVEDIPLEKLKRNTFKAYQDSLISYLDYDKLSTSKKVTLKLKLMGLGQDDITGCLAFIKENNIEEAYKFLERKFGKSFINKFNHFRLDDFENIKSATYEQFVELDKRLKNNDEIDTIVVTTGKYKDCMLMTKDGEEFDPYFILKVLKYCERNNKHARFHALFNYQVIEKFIVDKVKDKSVVLDKMKDYITKAINFIEEYNREHILLDDTAIINTVEVFNELVEYNKDKKEFYEEVWEKNFGVTLEDMIECIKSVEKPVGIDYMYNETLLEESPLRLKKIEDVIYRINSTAPNLIDVFGDQLHLSDNLVRSKAGLEALNRTNEMLKRIEYKANLKVEITGADIYVSSKNLDSVNEMIKDGEINDNQVKRLLNTLMNKVGIMINEKGVVISRVTYFTLLPNIDHNLVRNNLKFGEKRYETMYSGLYTDLTPDNMFLNKKKELVERVDGVVEKEIPHQELKEMMKNITKEEDIVPDVDEAKTKVLDRVSDKEITEDKKEESEEINTKGNTVAFIVIIVLCVIVFALIVMSIIYK